MSTLFLLGSRHGDCSKIPALDTVLTHLNINLKCSKLVSDCTVSATNVYYVVIVLLLLWGWQNYVET
jgi:hypothetical protein